MLFWGEQPPPEAAPVLCKLLIPRDGQQRLSCQQQAEPPPSHKTLPDPAGPDSVPGNAHVVLIRLKWEKVVYRWCDTQSGSWVVVVTSH